MYSYSKANSNNFLSTHRKSLAHKETTNYDVVLSFPEKKNISLDPNNILSPGVSKRSKERHNFPLDYLDVNSDLKKKIPSKNYLMNTLSNLTMDRNHNKSQCKNKLSNLTKDTIHSNSQYEHVEYNMSHKECPSSDTFMHFYPKSFCTSQTSNSKVHNRLRETKCSNPNYNTVQSVKNTNYAPVYIPSCDVGPMFTKVSSKSNSCLGNSCENEYGNIAYVPKPRVLNNFTYSNAVLNNLCIKDNSNSSFLNDPIPLKQLRDYNNCVPCIPPFPTWNMTTSVPIVEQPVYKYMDKPTQHNMYKYVKTPFSIREPISIFSDYIQSFSLKDIIPCFYYLLDSLCCNKDVIDEYALYKKKNMNGPCVESVCLDCGHVVDQHPLNYKFDTNLVNSNLVLPRVDNILDLHDDVKTNYEYNDYPYWKIDPSCIPSPPKIKKIDLPVFTTANPRYFKNLPKKIKIQKNNVNTDNIDERGKAILPKF